ncbi:OsmC family protein [Marinobacter sp. F4216]|uniref:OsmC family protein n=1 Tax=Marinobacter sp. F4216 TaxID=2874281 RepID=UPI001CBF9040|nr:OsmC family protein [Marinobacter sp. F4216]MBZ2168265.1 OsmC family protein [Marinobacter sp. F4216]
MQELPHHYRAAAVAQPEGDVNLSSDGVQDIPSAPPPEFGGPGDKWSPESLLVASVADCFILTFRAIARASKLDWTSLTCDVEGTLERVERVTRFTQFVVRASLTVPEGVDEAKARRMLEKAEHNCLITNSLSAEKRLEVSVAFAS